MFWSRCWSGRLKLKTLRYINAMILHTLILRVGEHNIGRVREVEKIRKIKEIKRIKGVRGVEEAIAKIK